ncbi:Tetratricopeptide TPR-1 [Macleaya cordata]|uniref:Tetratricopeptide TPR-1 n=1 Tax=Macleaya cordata TaxID=56857 RepID=A0A200R2C0_MACCD|nr:Tetratricopeptide TPR-1 [Macleaya cordata]
MLISTNSTEIEPAPGVDLEGLEVARECLEEVFKLNPSSTADQSKPGLLVEYFSSLDGNKQHEIKPDPSQTITSADAPSTSLVQNVADANISVSSKSQGEDMAGESHALGVSKDELLRQFLGALDRTCLFNTTNYGDDSDEDLDKVDSAVGLFYEAVAEMQRSGSQLNLTNLADTLKSKGNKAMQSKSYSEAIDVYTYAIAICENNAVYYCNRAAAYTQIHKYMEAIRDCLKSIEINPNYSKAYSRLGLAYYAQGNYSDAIKKGFKKALQLDPSSDSIKENIRVAEQKLGEQVQRTGQNQNAESSTSHNNQEQGAQSRGGSRNGHGAPPSFTSIPFNVGNLPADFANIFMNIAANAHPGQEHAQQSSGTDRRRDEQHPQPQPEMRMDGNISINVEGEEVLPEDLMGTWRSVMGMFTSGAVSQSQPHHHQQQPQQGDMNNRGPTPN